MDDLTDEQWNKIDALILADKTISAVQFYRQAARTLLNEAMDVVYPREEALLKLHPRHIPTTEDRIQEGIQRLDAIKEKVVVIECFWDGDSRGWIIRVAAIVDHPSQQHPKFTSYDLCEVRDLDNQVGKAVAIGEKLAKHRNVGFYITNANADYLNIDDRKRWWDSSG